MHTAMLVVWAVLGQVEAGTPSAPPPPPAETARVEPPKAEAPAAVPAAPLPRVVKVKLKDGPVLEGTLVEELPGGAMRIRLESGAEVMVPADAVVSAEVLVGQSRPGWFVDANRTRYLYGPSALMLKQNEFSVSQTELLLSGFSWGATDWLSLQLGTSIPFWFIPNGYGANLLLSVKAGGSITDWFHLAGGVQGLWLAGLTSGGVPLAGIAFATATFGTADLNLSASVGVPFSGFSGLATGAPIVTLSGNARLTANLALVTEHWLVAQSSFLLVDGLALRIMGEHLAVDLGLLAINAGGTFVPFPIPWVTFTYNFSL